MKLHVHKFPSEQSLANCREVADNAPAPIAPWVEMSIVEFNAWRNSFVWSVPAQPAYDAATQKVVPNGYAWDEQARTAIQQWAVVPLNAKELSDLDDSSEATVLHAAYQTFRNGTATNAQAQRAIAWLIKQEAIRRGLL